MSVFRYWQTWAGLAACGACAALGSQLGLVFDHQTLGAAIGGGVGGHIFSRAAKHVRQLP
jgi:hypothetical protein